MLLSSKQLTSETVKWVTHSNDKENWKDVSPCSFSGRRTAQFAHRQDYDVFEQAQFQVTADTHLHKFRMAKWDETETYRVIRNV